VRPRRRSPYRTDDKEREVKKVLLAGIALAVLAAVAVGAWLLLSEESETTARGACGGATYEFSAETDDGALEVSFELQSSGPGEIWQVRLLQEGDALVAGDRRTDDDGEIDLDVVADEDANDFEMTATPESGAACTAKLER
jgi:hypothetical protein